MTTNVQSDPPSGSAADRAVVSGPCVHSPVLAELLSGKNAAWSTKTAVAHASGELTYAQLDGQADLIAFGLAAKGIQPGDRVGVLLRRDALLIPSLLALLRMGVAYVPVDVTYPVQRIRSTLVHAQVSGVLCNADLMQELGVKVSAMQFDPAELIAQPAADGAAVGVAAATPLPIEDLMLASLIYTSGTTGEPKGVSVSRAAMANLLVGLQATPGVHEGDRVLGLSTIAFDIHVLELLAPLTCGATVVLADDMTCANPGRLLRLISQAKVTLVQATPSMWGVLLSAGLPALPLTRGVAGGERLAPATAHALSERLERCWNMYGPTEATVYTTAHSLSKQNRVSIGVPLANITVAIVTPADSVALGAKPTVKRVGERGELAISGAGLAAGYWQNPQGTAERFIALDIAQQPVRAYLTGDLAYIDGDGNVHCEGRLDQQVKLRGHRIELSEIEHAMVAHPDLSEAACCVHSFTAQDERLVAYHTNSELTEAQLRSFIAEQLPPYMVPQRFLRVPELPRLASGKLDRAALPRPQHRSTSRNLGVTTTTAGAGSAPSAERQALTNGWQQVLGGDVPGNHDNFMDQGGHSLLALALVQAVFEATGKELPLRLLVLEDFSMLVTYLEHDAPITNELSALSNTSKSGILNAIKTRFSRFFERS